LKRFQEIAGAIEGSLVIPLQQTNDDSAENYGFQFTVFQTAWSAILRCWDRSVVIGALKHKFWKLTLQVRYSL